MRPTLTLIPFNFSDADTESVKNAEGLSPPKENIPNGPEEEDRSSDALYDYNTEEIRQRVKEQNNEHNENIRSAQNSFDNLLINKNNNNINQKNENKFNQNNNHNNNEDFLDLQRSRSVINAQERNFGQQLIGNIKVSKLMDKVLQPGYHY